MMRNILFSNYTDQELVRAYKNNSDLGALEELIRRYSPIVTSICFKYLKNKEDSADAAWEILGKLFHLLKSNDIANFKSWLYVVSKNHCLMIKRQSERQAAQTFDPADLENIIVENNETEHHNYIELIKPEDLKMAMNQLKESQKICLEYFYYSRKTYKEISELTGFTVKQVKSFIQNGKRNLKNYLEQYFKTRNE